MEDLYGRKKAYVNTGLIALNVLYFLFLEATGSSENTSFMVAHGAMYAPLVIEKGEYYRLITSVFMHFGISHIMNNMLILFILGDNLERALGHKISVFLPDLRSGGEYRIHGREFRGVPKRRISRRFGSYIWCDRRTFIRRHHKSWPVGRFEYQTAGCDDCMFPVFWLYQHRC